MDIWIVLTFFYYESAARNTQIQAFVSTHAFISLGGRSGTAVPIWQVYV
jgi:hypothetical protein